MLPVAHGGAWLACFRPTCYLDGWSVNLAKLIVIRVSLGVIG